MKFTNFCLHTFNNSSIVTDLLVVFFWKDDNEFDFKFSFNFHQICLFIFKAEIGRSKILAGNSKTSTNMITKFSVLFICAFLCWKKTIPFRRKIIERFYSESDVEMCWIYLKVCTYRFVIIAIEENHIPRAAEIPKIRKRRRGGKKFSSKWIWFFREKDRDDVISRNFLNFAFFRENVSRFNTKLISRNFCTRMVKSAQNEFFVKMANLDWTETKFKDRIFILWPFSSSCGDMKWQKPLLIVEHFFAESSITQDDILEPFLSP